MTTRLRIPTRSPVALLALFAFVLATAVAARPAHAELAAYAEPAYTKTNANNTYWFHWTAIKGVNGTQDDYRYYVCYSTTKDGTQVEFHGGANGPGSTNCTGNLVSAPWSSTPPGGN